MLVMTKIPLNMLKRAVVLWDYVEAFTSAIAKYKIWLLLYVPC